MVYDLSVFNTTNITNYLVLTQRINEASDHLLGTLIFITIFIGVYFIYKKEDSLKDLMVSSFISIIFGVLLISMNLITFQIFIGVVFMFILFFIILFYI